MLCVHIAGNELGSLTHHFRQRPLAAAPDKCHVGKLHDASTSVALLPNLSPGRHQLSDPLVDQSTLQRPALLVGRVGDVDLEHLFKSPGGFSRF